MSTLQQKLATAFEKHRAGDIGTAATLYREVLAENPDQPDALHMMGVIAQQKGNTKLGLDLMTLALQYKPDMPLAWHNKALLLRVMGRTEEALAATENALKYDPNMAEAHDMAAALLGRLGRLHEAETHHKRAIELNPGNGNYRSNYAVVLLGRGDLKAAYGIVKESESLDRDSLSFSLGNILRASGYTEQSIPHYQRVSRLLPDLAEARMNEAMAWLLLGEFEKAWPIWRGLPDEREELRQIPRWQGERVGVLLLHEEQGLGDAIQCIRYIPLINNRADKIILRLSPYLVNLMRENFPDYEVMSFDEPAPKADARAQLMQLPAICGTTLATIPNFMPYLHAKEEWRAPWWGRLKNVPSPRIGFVWAGNPNHKNNANRSLELSQLHPLLAGIRKHAVSLQKWGKKDEAGLAASDLYDVDPWLNDFTDTAGLIMELDLVISVDTSVAHLAGALGKPVWVLIPFDPDWRWMLGREDSPWYPSMRLFRQDAPRDWRGALSRMAEDVGKLIAGDRSVLRAKIFTGPPLRQNPLAIQLSG